MAKVLRGAVKEVRNIVSGKGKKSAGNSAAANQQPTAGPSDTDRQQNSAYPGAPLANELSPPLNGPEDLNSDRSASENNDNNTTQPPGSIDSRPVQEEERDGRTRTGEERDQQEETAAANQQPTAGPSDTDRQQNSAYPGAPPANELSPPLNGPEDVNGDRSASENNDNNSTQQPGSIDSRPVQEQERDGRTRTGEERDQQEETVDNGLPQDPSDRGETSTGTQSYENLPVLRKDKPLLNKLAVGLDRTSHRVIKDWKGLACTKEINAPHDVWLRCGINSVKSCTQLLFNVLTAEFMETTLEDMINALTSIRRNDVKRIITNCYRSDEDRQIKFSDFARDKSDLIFQMTNLLDQESSVTSTWRHLGRSNPFRLTDERLDEIELPQSTQVLMEYLYTKDDFTIRFFYNKVKELQREDVVQILDKFINESQISRDAPMKTVIKLGDKTMRSICVRFNKSIPGTKDWKYLARSFGVPEDIYKDCAPERPKSPTESLFDWIFAEKDPQLTVGQLCNALTSIDRNDLVKDVREYYEQQSTRQP